MEIRVLRYFLETAREGNMTRAAERLFISQPTMSKQLKELEEELGTKLFIRSNYSIRLTEAGMLLRERAEDILSLVDKTEAEFKSLEEISAGDIYVGAPESEAMGHFAEVVRDLQKEYPKIREVMKSFFHCCVGNMMGNTIAVLVPCDPAGDSEEYEKRIEVIETGRKMVRELRKTVDAKFRLGVGAVHETDSLAESYNEAIRSL